MIIIWPTWNQTCVMRDPVDRLVVVAEEGALEAVQPDGAEHGVDEPEVRVVDELPDEGDRDARQDRREEEDRAQGDRGLRVLREEDGEHEREDRLEHDDDQHELDVVAERVAEQVVDW